MNKEPIGLYIFRYLMGFGMFAFMAMLYWSSVLIEDNVRDLRYDVTQLTTEIQNQRLELAGLRQKYLGDGVEHHQDLLRPSHTSRQAQVDPSFPNLLTPDPFYEKTLLTLLPKSFKPSGTRKSAIVLRPDNLHPFNNWSNIAAWVGQCTVSVAQLHFGKYETMAPDMAVKLEERKIPNSNRTEYWVHLRDNVFWQPLDPKHFDPDFVLAPHFLRKHQVTADDFKFYLDALMNPWVQSPGAVALRTYLGDIEEIRVIDPLTFVVRWKTQSVTEPNGQKVEKVKYMAKWMTGELRPLPRFVYQYFADGSKIVEDDTASDTYKTNSVWAQNFNQHWAKNIIVCCGPWLFDGMTERQISFRRNPDYYEPLAVLVERSETEFKENPDSVWQDFKSGKIDSYDLRPNQLLELEEFLASDVYKQQAAAGNEIKRLDFVNRSYTYIGWNEARPFFKDKKVRQALTMAIDRKRIIDKNLNGLGVELNGPFFRYSKTYDTTIPIWPYDPRGAKKLLEGEGWVDRNSDGVLDKAIGNASIPFSFSLTYFVKNPISQSIAEYVRMALKDLGIDCTLHGVDIADLSNVFDDKSFDAVLLGWAFGTPPEDPRQLWYSSGATEKGSSNAIGFSNAEADKIIDALAYEYDPQKREELYHRFDAIIHEEAPYTFLYTPKAVFLYRSYLQNVFIPAERQDLIPGADMAEPQPSIFWIKEAA